MRTKLIILSALALSTSACGMFHHDITETLAPGEYDETTVSTDANGTKTVTKNSTDVKVDDQGNRKAVVKSKVTQDPKGLMNKKTLSSTKAVEEEEDGKTSTSYEHEENN